MVREDKDYFTLRTERFTIEGRSRAGQESYFRIRELGIGLDIGRCPELMVSVPHVLVTHAHLDHAAGIPYYAGQRRLQRQAPGRIYIPSETIDDFRALMEIHVRLEQTSYDIELVGMSAGDQVPISRTLTAHAHQATHRVPARAYEIVERRHHLKPEFAALKGTQIAELRSQGQAVHDETTTTLLFYTGDTDRGILEHNNAIYRSEVLLIECSFIAEGDQERAAKYRHIHFDDIVDHADRFENRLILLTHISRRYSPEMAVSMLRERCPAVLRDRVRLAFPEPWQALN